MAFSVTAGRVSTTAGPSGVIRPVGGAAEQVAEATRDVLRRIPGTVVVVTAWVDGRPWGVTASTFTAVTLDPPTVSVCLFSHTAVARAARVEARFGISVLDADQVAVARAAAEPGRPKFLDEVCAENEGLVELGLEVTRGSRSWDPHDGVPEPPAPAVHGAMAHFDCWLAQVVTVGDHDVLFGTVSDVRTAPSDRSPLIYVDRTFHSAAVLRASTGQAPGTATRTA